MTMRYAPNTKSGKTRCHQGIPVSEIVYSLILTKKHLRRYIRDRDYIAFTNDRTTSGELTPLELYGIQQLNYAAGDFFDRALYNLREVMSHKPKWNGATWSKASNT